MSPNTAMHLGGVDWWMGFLTWQSWPLGAQLGMAGCFFLVTYSSVSRLLDLSAVCVSPRVKA